MVQGWREVAVDRETEGASDGGDRSNDVGAINTGGVPSVVGAVESFNGDTVVVAALVGGNGEGSVEEVEEAFH